MNNINDLVNINDRINDNITLWYNNIQWENIQNQYIQDNIQNQNIQDNIQDIQWDNPVAQIPDVITDNDWEPNPQDPEQSYTDPDGWVWRPDSNGIMCCTYYDEDRLCIIWPQNEDGSFPWQHDGTNYDCRNIGIDGRVGVFDYTGNLVATMQLNATLDVWWVDDSDEDDSQ